MNRNWNKENDKQNKQVKKDKITIKQRWKEEALPSPPPPSLPTHRFSPSIFFILLTPSPTPIPHPTPWFLGRNHTWKIVSVLLELGRKWCVIKYRQILKSFFLNLSLFSPYLFCFMAGVEGKMDCMGKELDVIEVLLTQLTLCDRSEECI